MKTSDLIEMVGATLSTNGIHELNDDRCGGVSTRMYVRATIIAVAWKAGNTGMTYPEFFDAVEAAERKFLDLPHVSTVAA